MISDELASKLREAAKVPLTPKMIYEQRVSWIIGQQHGREVTRAEVVRVLDELGILDPERLDAALAGKDAEQNAAPQGGDTLPATEPAKRVKGNVAPSQPVEAGPAGAAPGLPEEPNDVTTARRADAEVGWAT